MPDTSEPKSDSNIQAEEQTSGQVGSKLKEEMKQELKLSQSSKEKPIEFSDTTKKPPRMSSVDDYTMLPEGYIPKEEDVICSWARQNVSRLCEAYPNDGKND